MARKSKYALNQPSAVKWNINVAELIYGSMLSFFWGFYQTFNQNHSWNWPTLLWSFLNVMFCSVKSSTQIYNVWTLVLLPKVTRKLQASDTHHQYMLYIYFRSKVKSIGDGHKCTTAARTNDADKVARWSGKCITLMDKEECIHKDQLQTR